MSTAASDAEASFRQAVERMQAATDQFVRGNSERLRALCSQADDATIVGGWGDYERGWAAVGPRYEWAAARFQGGQLTYELVASGVSGDLAYTFHIERGTVRLVGVAEPAPMALRVTHIYRREGGEWKLLHRHADPLMAKQAVDAVLQR